MGKRGRYDDVDDDRRRGGSGGGRHNSRDRDGDDLNHDRSSKRSRPSSAPQDPNCTVFVGNLDYKTSWQNLKDHMRRAGNVESANIIMEGGNSGRSKGCGLVTYFNPKEAKRAVRELNESTLDGRTIYVRKDQRDGSRGTGEREEDSKPPAMPGGGTQLFVSNLPFEASWQDVKDYFRQCGNVDHVDVPEKDGRKRGYGIVRFANARDAAAAIRRFDRQEFQGRELEIRYDRAGTSEGRSGTSGPTGAQLWVGNLSFDTSWQDLKDHFRQCGHVEHADIPEKDGRKRGYGLVRFSNAQDADAAVRRLDGTDLQGRRLEVRYDRNDDDQKEQQRRGSADGDRSGGGGSTDARQVWVGNLSFDTCWQDLKDHFRQCGRVERAEVPEKDGRKRGYGLVEFSSSKDANSAVRRLDGTEFQGRKLEVRLDRK